MKKRNIIIASLFFLIILSLIIFDNNDLRKLYNLHYANKLLLYNEDGTISDIIENNNLPDYLHHAYYSKSKFPDDIDKWEKVTDISFFNEDKKIMDGKILRLDVDSSDEVFKNELGHMKPINNYYYLYTVEVKKFIFKKTYCSGIDENLINIFIELEQLPNNH